MRCLALLLSALVTVAAPPALAQDASSPAPDAASSPAPDAASSPASARPTGPWLHVRVQDGQGKESANVNVPVALVSLVLQMGDVQVHVDRELAKRQLSLSNLRQTWVSLRGAGDTDLVVTEDADETVRVGLEGGNLRVHVSDRATGALRTDASIPGRVVDALLGSDGERVDVGAAIRRLAEEGAGDLLVGRDGSQEWRVWID
jgi:hypothetical protein